MLGVFSPPVPNALIAFGYFLASALYHPASTSELLLPPGLTCSAASTASLETVKSVISPSPQATRTGTADWSSASPPPTDMKSCWQASLVTWAALNRAPSLSCTTIWRPSIPPAALHHFAKAPASWKNSALRPGSTVLSGSAKVAMSMALSETPRTVEEPPGPFSQIVPTPGHVPLVERLVRWAACAGPLPTRVSTDTDTVTLARTASQREPFEPIASSPNRADL